MLDELSSLKEEHSTPNKRRSTFNNAAVLFISLFSFAVVAFLRSTQSNASNIEENQITTTHLNEAAIHESPLTDGWYMYKTAFAGSNESWPEIWKFLKDKSGGYDCEIIGLGCHGKKLSCSYGGDRQGFFDSQLHFVVAPENLLFSKAKDGDSLGTSGWQRVAQESFGDMTKFGAFMHNKVQFFTGDISAMTVSLEREYPVFKRISVYEDDMIAAHVSVAIGGKIFEFIGLMPPDGRELGFSTFWSEKECPSAHKVNANLTHLQYLYEGGLMTPSKFDRFNSSFWLSTHSVLESAEDEGFKTMRQHLTKTVGAHVTDVIETDESGRFGCEVITFSLKNDDTFESTSAREGANVDLRFVHNNHYQVTESGHSVSEYVQYINAVHQKYLSNHVNSRKDEKWRNWDHWLDQHVGIKWSGEMGCHDQSRAITSDLLESDTLVGKRAASDGDHFYSAYMGVPMTIEYNTEDCYNGVGETAVCFCDSENSNRLTYLHDPDAKCLEDDTF